MNPLAVLVLVAVVLAVLAVAGLAFALDTRRRRAARHPAPDRPARQVEPIDTAQAQQDPPTVLHRTDGADDPTVATPVGDDPDRHDPDGDAPRR